MMPRLIAASIKFRALVLAAALVVMALGVAELRTMPRDVLPEFEQPKVEVQTEALGLSSAEVEQLITVPLEQDLLNGVPFVDTIESKSVPGLSSIVITFNDGTPIARARQVVNERLTQAAGIPNVAKPPQMIQPESSTSRLMLVGLSSHDVPLVDMGVLARWTIRPRLLGVPGVANVSIWGQRERQLQVQVDPQRLSDEGVTLAQVISTTGNALWWSPLGRLEANTPGTGGFFDGPSQRLGVFHESAIKSPADLARVPLEAATDSGEGAAAVSTSTRLGDVASVVEDHQPLIGDTVLRDGPGLLLVIEKLPEANVLDVTHGVEAALDELAPGLRGITIDRSLYRPATYIEDADGRVLVTLLIGLAIALVLLLALFASWRLALIGAVTVAVSELAAVAVLGLRGETLNPMLVAGLVLASVVLVAEVVTDAANVIRHARDDREDASIGDALSETRRPLAYATVIGLLVLIPLAVLGGEAGRFLPPIATSYAVAIACSLVAGLLVTPALASLLLRPGQAISSAPAQRWLDARSDRLAARSGGGRLALGGLVVLLLVGLVPLPFLERDASLVPTLHDTNVLVTWNGAPGTSLAEMDRVTARVLADVRRVPGVHDAGADVGRAVLSDQVVGTNAGQLWITIDDSADYDATLAAVRSTVDEYPGLDHVVTNYPSARIDEVLHRPTHDVTVRVYGANPTVDRAKAAEIRRAIASVDGVATTSISSPPKEAALRVRVDLDKAQAAGIKPGDVRRAAATLLSGLNVGALFQDQKVFDVVVWGTPPVRSNLDDVRRLLLETPTGPVHLGDVADVEVGAGETVIEHEDVSRFLDLGVDVSGRDASDVAADIRDRVDRVRFPLEHHAVVLSRAGTDRSARLEFLGVLAAALLVAVLLLQAAFASWRLAVVGAVTVPLAMSGGILAAVIAGDAVSVGTIAGLVVVAALATQGVTVLVTRSEQIALGEPHADARRVVELALRERLLPILATAGAAAVVALTLLVAGNGPGLEILVPAAVVVLGGVVTVVIATVVVAPGLIVRAGPSPTSTASLDLDALRKGD